MENGVNAKPLIGKEAVYMVNATGGALVVKCDKWTLVGNQPYIKTNPADLPAWTVTFVPMDGFDGYCAKGFKALAATGATYTGSLNAGTVSDTTFVVFSPANRDH